MAYLSGEELFEDLPSDSKEAFIVFVERVHVLWQSDREFSASDYVEYIRLFQKHFEINVESDFLSGKSAYEIAGRNIFEQFQSAVISKRTEYQITLSRESSLGNLDSVVINREIKAEIRTLVEEAKGKVSILKLDEQKKDALMRKLNAFVHELDQSKTRLVALTSATIQVAGATGQAAKKLKPVAKLLERITKAVGLGAEESKSFPKWEDPKRIEPPRKQIEARPDIANSISPENDEQIAS